MRVGNKPNTAVEAYEGRIYWELRIGAVDSRGRYYTDGWRVFDFIVHKRFCREDIEAGAAYPTYINIGFAYWLPFQKR